MYDGNDEQLLCLLTFKCLAFILEFSQDLLKSEIYYLWEHEPKTKV
jgi:hypothetical protein